MTLMTPAEIVKETQSILDELSACPLGISYLDDALGGLLPGEVCLIGSRSGFGKTEVLTNAVLQQQANGRCRRTVYFAADHDRGEIEKRVLWRFTVNKINEDKTHPLHGKALRFRDYVLGKLAGQIESTIVSVENEVNFALRLSEANFIYRRGLSVEEIVTAMKFEEYADLFIIDHFHALKEAATFEGQQYAIEQITNIAEQIRRPVLMAVQFRKPSPTTKCPVPEMEEISGNSQIVYNSKIVITFNAKYYDDDEENLTDQEVYERQNNQLENETYFRICKARDASEAKAFVAVHGFDNHLKTYTKNYFLRNHVPFLKPSRIKGNYPDWAVNRLKAPVHSARYSPRPDLTHSNN